MEINAIPLRNLSAPGAARLRAVLFFFLLLIGFGLRFAALTLKPPHADEGVNGYFVNQIWQNGFFRYQPDNYHGPLLFYLFQISEKLFGFGIHAFRIVAASFSLFSIVLVLRARSVMGPAGRAVAACLFTLSPAMVFFGRSAIHEPVYLFFQVLCVTGFVTFLAKAHEENRRRELFWLVAGLLGCALLKETFVILAASLVAANLWTVAISGAWLRTPDFRVPKLGIRRTELRYLLILAMPAVVVWLAFYTGFFHYNGTGDFFRALLPWLKTGVGGSGHEKPASYWLALMLRYEWVAFAACCLACAGAFHREWKLRFFSAFALLNLLVYSVIPYKTPWCIITILWPFFVIAGLAAEDAAGQGKRSFAAVVVVSLLLIATQAHALMRTAVVNFVNYADSAEPYVYVQTKRDFVVIDELVRDRLRRSPRGRTMKIQVNLGESWPLPWYFSRFPGYRFGGGQTAFDPDADLIFAETGSDAGALAGRFLTRAINLRDGREPFFMYVKQSVFGERIPGFIPIGELPRQ